MFASFRDYLDARKPGLDEAFREQLAKLIGGVALRSPLPFLDSLLSGKKIRGCLSCLVTEVLGGAVEAAIPRALAVELIQTATLIHDDFVDQDTTRRNLPASWTLEGARRAVLVGDVIFAGAIQMMSDLGREDGMVVSDAIAQVSRGALHEPLDPLMLAREIERNGWKKGLYEKIIYLKTGILFGAACRLGAIAARVDAKLRDACFRYGVRIGEAYQIADDLKEVKEHLQRRSILPKHMVALAPTFLYFDGKLERSIRKILQGKELDEDGGVWESFGLMAKLMEDEIESRLRSALGEIEAEFPRNAYGDLARRVPWELIRMFNES